MTDLAAPPPASAAAAEQKNKGCLFYGFLTGFILLIVIASTAAITVWWVNRQINAKPFEKTELTLEEKATLDAKLDVLNITEEQATDSGLDAELEEELRSQPIQFTEKEINAWLQSDTDFGDFVQIALGNDLINAKINFQVPDDAPLFKNRTVRINLGLKIVADGDQLLIQARNVRFAGMPIPGAWLKEAGLDKDANLAGKLFQGEDGIQKFMAGIKQLKISPDGILMELNE